MPGVSNLEAIYVTLLNMGSMRVSIVTGLFWTAITLAAPPVTVIDDVLYKADGTPFEGMLMINWRSFEGPDMTNIPTNSVSARIAGGRLYVRLAPTTTAPTAAYYSVRYITSGSVQFTELWSVPPSDVALRVRDVRVNWPPATTAMVAPQTDISIEDVDGLTAALDMRPEKGQGYAPLRAAVIGAGGELEAAAGEASDCLRVDGTATPCASGTSGGVTGFVDNDVPAGSVDGSNGLFVLTGAPAPAASLHLFRNGLLQLRDFDYTLSGNTVLFAGASIPQPGDVVLASYRTEEALTATYGFVDGESPAETPNGSNVNFTLSQSPSPAGSLMLYRNGVLQQRDLDYTLTGNVITFSMLAIPQTGDILQASYRTGGL